MVELTVLEATSKLTEAIGKMSEVDLIEVYGELFPGKPTPGSIAAIRDAISEYVKHGLAVEEVLDLWNVVFPDDRGVGYDQEAGKIQYAESSHFLRSLE